MSYDNFKQTVWSKAIQRELKKDAVLDADCNHQFDGDVKIGGKVKILGVSKPTIGDYTGASIGTPEELEDASIFMDIDKAKFFNFAVDDVDKAQTIKGMMEAYRDEATTELVDIYEHDIAKEAQNAGLILPSTSITTEKQACNLVDDALVALRENGVHSSMRTVIEVRPWFFMKMMNNVIELKTDNDLTIKNGIMGHYKGAYVKVSNNLFNNGSDDLMMVRTTKAIAAAKQIDKVEAYRPQDTFKDAIKGLLVYGIKTVRPKEVVTIQAH